MIMDGEKSQDLQLASCRPRRANPIVPVQGQMPGNKGAKDRNCSMSQSLKTGAACPSLKKVRQSKFCLNQCFVLSEPSAHWMRPTHIMEGSLLYSFYQFKY